MEIKYSRLKDLLKGEQSEKVRNIFKGEIPKVDILAYYSPEGTNWSYNIGIAKAKDNNIYIVVTYCGEVKGGRPIYL
jgi:hypothetical protein